MASYIAKPPEYIFKWPVGLNLPQGPPEGSLFGSWFTFFMDVRVPITIAAIYATVVHALNRIRKTNKEPLAICKSRVFHWFVITHNLALCIYSAWTCMGMSAAIYRSVFEVSKMTVSGMGSDRLSDFLDGESGLVGSNSTTGSTAFWRSLCDVNEGIWEKGLSYFGFFFYLSKFYEVVDTLIILAKGKQSSLLQTYHHAGAMLSMWAGIRFASPPIWIFVVFNSLIHTIMYFYYTLSTLKVRVPKVLKRALTTAQICQFVFGGSFALLHMFIYYFNPDTGSYTSCLRDPGQSFALFFNVFYLAPLTYLFIMFFLESYVRDKTSKLSNPTPSKESGTKKVK
jgi:hypothetical protein